MMERVKDIIKESLPKEIYAAYGEVLEKPPKKETIVPVIKPSVLSPLHYDNAQPIDENGQSIIFDNKNRDFNSSQYKAQTASRKAAQQLIRDIQRFKKETPNASIKNLAVHFGISKYLAERYLKMTNQEIDAMDSPKAYKKRPTVMDNYINIIYKMLKDGINDDVIYGYVCRCGYNGNPNTLLGYISAIRKNNFPERKKINPMKMGEQRYPEGTVVVSRTELLKYVLTCNPKTPLDSKIAEIIDAVNKMFPMLVYAGNAFRAFHSVIMGNSTDDLNSFIKEYETSELRTFCEHIKKDIAPSRTRYPTV